MITNAENTSIQKSRFSKSIHIASTAWFVLCVCYLVVLGLRQAGVHWWVIFSLSGYSALLIFLMVSLYLFAIFKGVTRNQKTIIEHPLTTSPYYSVFYDITPFLGAIYGLMCLFTGSDLQESLVLISTGSLWTTFFAWIIIDPLAGMIEMLLPSSRTHRHQRQAETKELKRKEKLERDQLFEKIEAREQELQEIWGQRLEDYAEKLTSYILSGQNKEKQAMDIGVLTWQLGGIECMKQLHSMVLKKCKETAPEKKHVDFISVWWDGIGTWNSRPLEKLYAV